MKYFIDTEFLEGTQKTWFGKQTKPTIDLISIGIVAEDGREYYAISKDFNLKEAWNRYEWKDWNSVHNETLTQKVYWIRENVLTTIYNELAEFHIDNYGTHKHFGNAVIDYRYLTFTYKNLKWLINKYGKTNKQIAQEIKDFVSRKHLLDKGIIDQYGFTSSALKTYEGRMACAEHNFRSPEFYGYYCDYDWVVFCWLFGKMNDLPKGFPMYCKDLKQEMDRIIKKSWKDVEMSTWGHTGIENIERLPNYPKQTNEHNALADARWNFELYRFIQNL